MQPGQNWVSQLQRAEIQPPVLIVRGHICKTQHTMRSRSIVKIFMAIRAPLFLQLRA
jgi:hypothetical protein